MTAQAASEDIAVLIHDLKQFLVPTEDVGNYRDVADAIQEASAKRRRENDKVEESIQAQTQTLKSLRANTTRSAAEWKAASAHNAEMDAMESTKFGLAKRINEQESQIAALEAQLRAKREELQEVEKMDVESETPFDRDTIALMIFRQLAFSAHKDKSGETDDFSYILAHPKGKATAPIAVEVSEGYLTSNGITPYILAEQLWKAAE